LEDLACVNARVGLGGLRCAEYAVDQAGGVAAEQIVEKTH
jgi:hypothetical protein